MRKITSILAVIALVSMVLSACVAPQPASVPAASNGEAAAGPAMMTEIGKGEGELNIVSWPGYIERGETDPAYDWVTNFETATGCKVNAKSAASSDEMVSLMNEGGFDIVTASGDATQRLIAGGTVQAINTDLVPSWSKVDERLQSGPWYTVDGNHYGVPYLWGTNVLMYNTEIFKEAPTSWEVVFKETTLGDGASNKGRVQAYYGPIYIADAALYLKKHNPELGIEDPYALTQEQFDAVVALLQEQRAVVGNYWSDAVVQMDDFTTNGFVASTSWPFQVNLLVAAGQPIASVVPEEGSTGWADTTMMHAKAKNPNCAYMWLEHSLSASTQGDLAAWFGGVPVVPSACEGNELLGAEGCKTNGIDNFEKISFWRTPVADCGGGKTCVPYSQWVEAYTAIKGGN